VETDVEAEPREGNAWPQATQEEALVWAIFSFY
jgi:hypothetical protein